MITPGTILLGLLAVASVAVDAALASHAEVGPPSETRLGCLLGFVLGQLALLSAGWLRSPAHWRRWCPAVCLGIVTASLLLAAQDNVPWLHWTVVLGAFTAISLLLPWVYQSSAQAAPPQFSLAGLLTITTLATLTCGAVLHGDFPWQQLPLVLPGLVLWAAPALVCSLTLTSREASAPGQLIVGLSLLLITATLTAVFVPTPLNRLPLVIAWQSLYLLAAGLIVLQARRNDARWSSADGRQERRKTPRITGFSQAAVEGKRPG